MKRIACSLLALTVALSPVKAETPVCLYSDDDYLEARKKISHYDEMQMDTATAKAALAADKLNESILGGHPFEAFEAKQFLVQARVAFKMVNTQFPLDFEKLAQTDGETLLNLALAADHPEPGAKYCFETDKFKPFFKAPEAPKPDVTYPDCGAWVCEQGVKPKRKGR